MPLPKPPTKRADMLTDADFASQPRTTPRTTAPSTARSSGSIAAATWLASWSACAARVQAAQGSDIGAASVSSALAAQAIDACNIRSAA